MGKSTLLRMEALKIAREELGKLGVNTPVYVGNCLRRVLVTEDYKPYVYPIVSQLATALGLALREDI